MERFGLVEGAHRFKGLDQAVFHPAQKILRIGLRPFGGAGIIPVLECDFLQSNLGGVFWLEAACHQLSCAGGETLGIGKRGRFPVQRTIVFLKFAGSQPVVCTLRILIGQHRRDGKRPAAL